MKRLIRFFFLHYFAGIAFQKIINDEKFMNIALKKSSEENIEPEETIAHLSYTYARAMAKKII